MKIPQLLGWSGVVALTLLVTACGPNSDPNSPQALFESKGCAACHGQSGEGRVGPRLIDLYGSTVSVVDGDGNESEVYADGAYLRESITDPAAQKAVGFNTPMPKSNLSPEEVEVLVAHIESMSSVPPDVSLPDAAGGTSATTTP